MLDAALAAGIASAVTLVIREFVAGLIQLRSTTSAADKKDRDEYEERMKRYLAEAEADRDEARKEKAEAERKAMESFRAQIDCEKNTIRLEAKIELLTRLSGIDLNHAKVHQALQQIEREVADKKQTESKNGGTDVQPSK